MLGQFVGICALLLLVASTAQAQTVPPTPAPTAVPVAEEQHPIQVGDVIMAPAIEAGGDDDERERAAPAPKSRPHRWYGAPTLPADGLAYGSIALGATAEGTAGVTLPLGIGTFLLAGPIVHAAHGRWGRMGLSIAARTALPLLGLIAGASSCTGDNDCSSAVVGMAVVGMLAATIIDVTALPYEPLDEPPLVQPMASLGRDRVWLGAGATF